MADLKPIEKKYFEELFDMRSGYVISQESLTNATFSELISSIANTDIYSDRFSYNGNSKAKRLRSFWELESDKIVGEVLKELLEIWKFEQIKNNKAIDTMTFLECKKVVNKLLGIKNEDAEIETEKDFLSQEFLSLNLSKLNIDLQFENVVKQRLDEIQKSLKSKAYLSVIFLCGSTLEGLLQDKAIKNMKDYNTSKSIPKDKNGKVLVFDKWTLNNFIDVSFECGFIEHDIKEYSHSLRAFRNYIHPREQALYNFNPDKYTAKISWQVLQATIASLSGQRN